MNINLLLEKSKVVNFLKTLTLFKPNSKVLVIDREVRKSLLLTSSKNQFQVTNC